jgi:hypothetical protein
LLVLTGCLAPSAEVARPDLRMPVMVVQPDTASGGTTEAALPVPDDRSLIGGITVGDVVIALPVNAGAADRGRADQ